MRLLPEQVTGVSVEPRRGVFQQRQDLHRRDTQVVNNEDQIGDQIRDQIEEVPRMHSRRLRGSLADFP